MNIFSLPLKFVVITWLSFLLASCDSGPSLPLVGPKPPPVTVDYRESVVGKGIVLIIQNPSNETLYGIHLTITASDGHSTSAKVVDVLKPANTTEVGWMELDHWILEPNEIIRIYAKGYSAPYKTYCTGVKQ